MKQVFYNAVIIGVDGELEQTAILVEDGKIKEFLYEPINVSADELIDCKGNYILAGFIDLHVHGGGGYDFMDGNVEAMKTAANTHLKHGTTTIYPTTMSAPMDEIEDAFKNYRKLKELGEVENLAGLHLEGPFLSPKMCGAQRLDLIISPNEEHIKTLKDNADIIARITCAPEVDGVMQMAKELLPCGISFSMGHTMATYEQAEEAFDGGFSAITHLYSATSGFHKVNQKVHIGVTQAAYGLEDIFAELIGDGCHVPKELLRLVYKLKRKDRVCLVTDAMRAAGTDVKESYLGKICPENRVIIDDGVAKLPDFSFFAGSIGTMDRAFRFAVQVAGLSLSEASRLVSLNPALLMKIDKEKGSIEVDKQADFVLMNKDLEIQGVYIKGKRTA